MQDKRIEDLLQKAKKGENVSAGEREALQNSLNANQKELLQKALSDKNTLQQLLNSPQAKELFRKFEQGRD